MNRREFLSNVVRVPTGFFIASAASSLIACGSSSRITGPTETSSFPSLPSRAFNPSLGGETWKSFDVESDGPMYAAMQAANIIPGSGKNIASEDTKSGIRFSGNLIYYVIADGKVFQPENGFDFKINDREIYDPMTDSPLNINFYDLPVYKGNRISLTLPPKWNGVSD